MRHFCTLDGTEHREQEADAFFFFKWHFKYHCITVSTCTTFTKTNASVIISKINPTFAIVAL